MRYSGRNSPSGSVYSQMGEKGGEGLGENPWYKRRRGMVIAVVVGAIVALAVALGVGLGLGLGRKPGVAVQVMDNVGTGVGGTSSASPVAGFTSATSTSQSNVLSFRSTSVTSAVVTSFDPTPSLQASIPIDTYIFPASDAPTDSIQLTVLTTATDYAITPLNSAISSSDPFATPSPSPTSLYSDISPSSQYDMAPPSSLTPTASPQFSTDPNGGTYVHTTRPIVRLLLRFDRFSLTRCSIGQSWWIHHRYSHGLRDSDELAISQQVLKLVQVQQVVPASFVPPLRHSHCTPPSFHSYRHP